MRRKADNFLNTNELLIAGRLRIVNSFREIA
jgi:hypothetical protein